MSGNQVIERDWGQTWRRRGECFWCKEYSYLTASCSRCQKWSCGKEVCIQVIKESRRCIVSAASI